MARRIALYQIARGVNLGDPETWNVRFEDIDLRLAASEDALANLDAVANRVESLALDRINNIITPLVIETQERIASIPDLFTATSTTSVPVGTGHKTFVVEASMRNTFAVGGTLQAARIGDPAVWMQGSLVSYVPETGVLVIDVEEAQGAGTFADWRFRISGRRGGTGATGPVGMTFRGAYAGGTVYVPRDAVYDQNSLWLNKLASTGGAPPTLPATSNANWELIARGGADPNALQKAQNLNDLASKDTALTNLGGTTTGVAVFKAASQASARSAIGASSFSGAYADLTGRPTLFSGSYADLSGRPSLGTAASLNAGSGAGNVVQLDGTGKLPAVDGSQLTGVSAGKIRQVVQTTNATLASLSGTIPLDDTVPISTEGTQIMSQSITLGSTSNKVLVRVGLSWSSGSADSTLIAAIFRGTTCIQVLAVYAADTNINNGFAEILDAPATASSVTYSVRVGNSTGGSVTVRINNMNASRLFGGAMACDLTLMEVA